jgi:DNA polymerase-4
MRSDRETVSAALTAHTEAVARRVRHHGYRGRLVTLKLELGARRGTHRPRLAGEGYEPIYPLLTRRKSLPELTDDGALIRATALALWDAADVGEAVRLLGVSLSALEKRAEEQLELFAPARAQDKLGPALEAIQARFDRSAIHRAVDEPGKVTPTMQKKRGE